jgi:hypothetical protein
VDVSGMRNLSATGTVAAPVVRYVIGATQSPYAINGILIPSLLFRAARSLF